MLGKTKQQSNIRARGGTIKRVITTLLLTLLVLGNSRFLSSHQQWEGKSWTHSSETSEHGSFKQGWEEEPHGTLSTASTTGTEKETGSFQCAEILLCRKFTVHFFLKNTTPKGIPSSGLDATLKLLHPTQHFWCLTCKSQCLKIWKEPPVHYFWWVSES